MLCGPEIYTARAAEELVSLERFPLLRFREYVVELRLSA